MGISDSPLRDRVIFVEGAPRGGTTLLTALLTAHPDVAGIAAESHLFDSGVGALFDNHEGGAPWQGYLSVFVSREQLVDCVRDLVDSILVSMRQSTGMGARFVVEKTPASRRDPAIPLSRKLECYPDAWYVHIVRDGDAVTRSLMRAPWNRDQSAAASERWWREGVAAIRQVLSAQPRYRELRYEELVEDPVGATSAMFEWLGLAVDEAVRERIALLGRERFADLGPIEGDAPVREASSEAAPPPKPSPRGPLVSRLRNRFARLANRRRDALANAFAASLREGDTDRLAGLIAPSIEVDVRSADGDLRSEGRAALDTLAAVGREVYGKGFMSEGWTSTAGKSFATVVFSGIRHDGDRVDLSISVLARRGRIVRVAILSAGPLSGRPLREWSPP